MSELSLSQPNLPALSEEPSKPHRHWGKTLLAGALSLLFPGMGQLYNRQPRKAIWMTLISFGLSVSILKTHVWRIFSTMVLFFVLAVFWKLFVAGEAARTAASGSRKEKALPFHAFTYTLIGAMILIVSLFPTIDQVKKKTGFAAFKIPSRSMCPTLCIGDRLVADMHAYATHPPQRGEIIMLKHPASDNLFVKRVIGISGDSVAPGPDGTLLVNGRKVDTPATCGTTLQEGEYTTSPSAFNATTVPQGQLFVVGDNLDHSFDSRFPEFGAVTLDMVRGMPLYIYWSQGKGRIGCSIR